MNSDVNGDLFQLAAGDGGGGGAAAVAGGLFGIKWPGKGKDGGDSTFYDGAVATRCWPVAPTRISQARDAVTDYPLAMRTSGESK